MERWTTMMLGATLRECEAEHGFVDGAWGQLHLYNKQHRACWTRGVVSFHHPVFLDGTSSDREGGEDGAEALHGAC